MRERERALIFSNNNNNNNNTRNLYIIKQQHSTHSENKRGTLASSPSSLLDNNNDDDRSLKQKRIFVSVPIYERDILWAKDCTTVQMRKVPVCVCNFFAAAAAPAPGEYKKRKQKEKEITNNCPLTKKTPCCWWLSAEMKEKTVHLPPASGPFSFLLLDRLYV